MNSPIKFLFVAFLTSNLASSTTIYGWLADFDALEEAIEQQIEQSFQSMKAIRKQLRDRTPTAHSDISINTNNDAAIITLKNIACDNLQAQLNDANNQLSITTPTKKIVLTTHHNIIGIETRDVSEQIKSDKNQKEIRYVSSSISHTQTTVPHILLLEKQNIDYDADQKELIITIPFKSTAKERPVIINKKIKQKPSVKQSAPEILPNEK